MCNSFGREDNNFRIIWLMVRLETLNITPPNILFLRHCTFHIKLGVRPFCHYQGAKGRTYKLLTNWGRTRIRVLISSFLRVGLGGRKHSFSEINITFIGHHQQTTSLLNKRELDGCVRKRKEIGFQILMVGNLPDHR